MYYEQRIGYTLNSLKALVATAAKDFGGRPFAICGQVSQPDICEITDVTRHRSNNLILLDGETFQYPQVSEFYRNLPRHLVVFQHDITKVAAGTQRRWN